MMARGHRHQRGVALVLALLVVALASALAVSMGNDYLVRMRRFENQLSAEQAHHYLLSAEQMAQHLLLENAVQNQGASASDHLGEAWNQPQSIAVDGGVLRFHFESSGAQMPIHQLRNGSDLNGRKPVPYNLYQERFIRLLRSFDELPLSEQEALAITQAVFDWIDVDTQPEGLGGMEEGSYQSLGLDYRPPNTYMSNLSELQLIPRISPRLYRLLAPHVSVVSPGPYKGINVNTASRHVLRSLPDTYGLSPISEEELDTVLGRHGRHFSGIASFKNLPGWGGQVQDVGLNVVNREFLMRGEALINGHSFRMASQMYVASQAEGSRAIIIFRSYSWQ